MMTRAFVTAAATVAAAALLAGCGGSAAPAAQGSGPTQPAASTAPASPAAASSAPATPWPVACTSITNQGTFATPSPAAAVTLPQIGTAVGFTVSSSMPDPQNGTSFQGYEGCRYQFTTPAGGALEDINLIIGSFASKTAAAQYAATVATKLPFSEREGSCDGCGYAFTPVPGLGDQAVKGYQAGTDEVVAARRGDVYVEIGPGELKESRMINLAKLVLAQVQ